MKNSLKLKVNIVVNNIIRINILYNYNSVMKIAILTLPLYTNYGGILQCYALQTVLEREGYDVKVLTKPRYSKFYYLIWGLAIIKRFIKKVFFRKDVSILYAPYQLERKIIRKNTDRFIKTYIHSYSVSSWNKSLSKRFDAIVVGSDQVWRPLYANPEEYCLSFINDARIKRISYAASFGVDNVNEFSKEQLENCSSLLKKFDSISVREFTGVDICRENFGVEAVQLLDPTLLLKAEDYISLIDAKEVQEPTANMLVYVLDKTEEKVSLVNEIAKDRGLIPYWLDSADGIDRSRPLEYSTKMPVEQWLCGFRKADFVFTDSFHGCIFSIIFNKQFIVFGNEVRGMSRFVSLLRTFNLNDRLIYGLEDYENNKIALLSTIDYEKVNKILNKERIKSFDYLGKTLKS